ncbi:MAG: hypothetical protein ACOYOU_11025 [Kiritimatiellia bacterium]
MTEHSQSIDAPAAGRRVLMGIPARATFTTAFRAFTPVPVRGLVYVALAFALLLSLANVWLGDLNQDEGWYLYAARCFSEGALPYHDFAFTQGPVMPLIYGAFVAPLVNLGGVVAGRAATALLGLLAAALAAALAARLAPRGLGGAAGVAAFALVAVNAYQSYFFAVVKTYALGAVWLLAGFVLLSAARGQRRRLYWMAAGMALALAAGTRLSAGIVLPVVALALWFDRRRQPGGWFWFGASAALMLSIEFIPFLLLSPEGLRFGLLDYHAGRRAGSLLAACMYKAGFISRVAQAYLPALGLALVAAGVWWARRPGRSGRGGTNAAVMAEAPLPWLLGVAAVAFAAVTLVHLAAPFPYDDYEVMVYPLGVAALVGAAVRMLPAGRPAYAAAAVLLAACVVSAGASPINQDWFSSGRDRIWWRLKDRPALSVLRDTARQVQKLTPPGSWLLTQDTYLAVEANRPVPPGMELGPFCYYPEWTTERAQACRVLNRAMFEDLLATAPAPMAAFSGYGLSIASPGVTELPPSEQAQLQALVECRYAPAGQVAHFGQAHTRLDLYRLRATQHSGLDQRPTLR